MQAARLHGRWAFKLPHAARQRIEETPDGEGEWACIRQMLENSRAAGDNRL
jgi:hypothetical protein